MNIRCFIPFVAFLILVHVAYGKVGFRQVTSTHPVAVQRGTTAEIKLRSNFTLDETHTVLFAQPGMQMTFLEEKPIEAPRKGRGSAGTPFRFRVNVPEDQLPGVYEYRVATNQAVSSVAQLLVTDYPVVVETEDENGTADNAQTTEFPVAICGVCERFEDVDCYQFAGEKGQRLTLEIYAQRVMDKLHGLVVRGPRIYAMDPILTLIGPSGQIIAQNDNFYGGDSFVYCELPSDGDYVIEVRDARYAGDARYSYCLEISDRPYVHAIFPLAVQQGTSAQVELIGHHASETLVAAIEAAANRNIGWSRDRIRSSVGTTNPVAFKTSAHPQILESANNNSLDKADPISLPCGINGRLLRQDEVDFFSFDAKKNQRFHFEIEARRYGSPIDSVLEVYDSKGKLITESDDLTALKTKDSRLFWTAPADGKFAIGVRDLHGRGGARYVYHLRAEPAEPDFELFGEYYYAMLAPGTRMIWFARVERLNGFEGPVAIEVENLPSGVNQTPVTIPPGMQHCAIILSAEQDAGISASLVRVCGRATIKSSNDTETEIVRYGTVMCEQQSSGGGQARWPIETQIVGVTKALDLTSVTATPQEITLQPGGTAEVDVAIERVEGFEDPVTLAGSFDYSTTKLGEQFPPGVSVSSKSKLRLSGKNLKGKLVLQASDKAAPVDRLPIAALARVSITFSITTNYASNPIYLTVESKSSD